MDKETLQKTIDDLKAELSDLDALRIERDEILRQIENGRMKIKQTTDEYDKTRALFDNLIEEKIRVENKKNLELDQREETVDKKK